MSLESVHMPFPYIMGPMVGISHVAMRDVVRSFIPEGLDVPIFCEMLSTLRLPSERLDCAEELKVTDKDRNSFIPQILGNERWYIERSIQKLLNLEPRSIDINMGCPAKQTLRHNWGVRLMGDPQYAADVVKTTRECYDGKLSVKLRCGIKKLDIKYLLDFTEALESAGADWLTIHARLQAEKHKGTAYWDQLREIKAERKIPIVANGDIQTCDDAIHIVDKLGLDGAMVGRAVTARPWIFWQIAYKKGLCTQRPPESPEEEGQAYLDAAILLAERLAYHFPNSPKNLRKLRFFVTHSHKWLHFGHSFYKVCMKAKTLEQAHQDMCRYKEQVSSFPMTQRISLL